MTFLVVLVIVAIVSLVLGMAISNHSSRPHTHETMARTHEHETHTHTGRSGWGWALALLLAVPCVLAVFGWMSFEDRQSATVTTLGTTEVASHPTELSPASGEAVAPDRVTRPLLTEAPVASQESEAVTPAEMAANDRDSGESPDPPAEFGSAASYDSAEDTATLEPATAGTSSSSPRIDLKADLALWTVFPMLCLAFLIAAGIWIAHRRQHWSLSGMVRSTVQSLWVVPILASVGWVGYLVWPHLSAEPLVRNTDYNPSQTEFVPYVKLENEPIDEIDEFLLKSNNNSPTQDVSTAGELPDWVTQGVQNKGGFLHVPVRSKWRVTPSAADNYARAQAMRVIRKDFSLAYPHAEEWRIDAALEDLDAVVAESVESKVFPFREEPMYQTHLLVELSDEVRGELVDRWKPAVQEFRMGLLLTFGGLLTLVCFAGATCLNVDLQTAGHYRRWLRLTTVLVVVAAAAVAHGVLNSLWFPHSV